MLIDDRRVVVGFLNENKSSIWIAYLVTNGAYVFNPTFLTDSLPLIFV